MGSGIVRQTGEVDRLTKVKPFPPNDWLERTASSMENCGGVGWVRGRGRDTRSRPVTANVEYRHRVIPRVWSWAFNHTAVIRRDSGRSCRTWSRALIRLLNVRSAFVSQRLLVATSVFFCCIPTVCVYVLYMLPSRRESRT